MPLITNYSRPSWHHQQYCGIDDILTNTQASSGTSITTNHQGAATTANSRLKKNNIMAHIIIFDIIVSAIIVFDSADISDATCDTYFVVITPLQVLRCVVIAGR